MLNDRIVTTHTATLPDAIDGQDGFWYLPCVTRTTNGVCMFASVHVYRSNEDGTKGEWAKCLYGQGGCVNAVLDSVSGDITEGSEAAYALEQVALACLLNN